MKITEKKLRKIIRDTISEVVTPDYMYSDDARGSADPNAYNPNPVFKGFNPEDVEQQDLVRAPQSLGSSTGAGYGPRASQSLGSSMGAGYGRAAQAPGQASAGSQAFDSGEAVEQVDVDFVMDSQVLRGQPGNIDRSSLTSGDIYTVAAGDTVLDDLSRNYQLNATRDTLTYARGIIDALSNSGIIRSIDGGVEMEDLDFIGVRGRESGKVYTLSDWISSKKSGQIGMHESKKRRRVRR